MNLFPCPSCHQPVAAQPFEDFHNLRGTTVNTSNGPMQIVWTETLWIVGCDNTECPDSPCTTTYESQAAAETAWIHEEFEEQGATYG